MTIFDFSQVPSELLKVIPEAGPYVNAGILHNLGLCKTNDVFINTGLETDPAIAAENVLSFSRKAESNGILPKGSVDILNEALTKFISSNSFSEGCKVWNDYLNIYNKDDQYKDTMLIAVLSIGNYSSQFWTYAIESWTSNETQNAQNKKFKIPRWLQVVCSVLTGALSGAQIGLEVSAATGVGAGVGAVVGGVIGGVGASVAFASSGDK